MKISDLNEHDQDIYELVPPNECPTDQDEYTCGNGWCPCGVWFERYGIKDMPSETICGNSVVDGQTVLAFRRKKTYGFIVAFKSRQNEFRTLEQAREWKLAFESENPNCPSPISIFKEIQ